MSGLEALGVACNIFQTISFARETVTICRAIYHGQKTPDAHLEENATAMIEASKRVKASCSELDTSEAQCVAHIAGECTTTAQNLESEVQRITKLHKDGNILKAIHARFKSTWKRREIEDIDKALRGYTDTMQTLLIEKICNQSKAGFLKQEQGFHKWNQDLQSFILQIDAGYTKMEDLLVTEGRLTRDHVTEEAKRAEESMKAHVTRQVQEHKTNQTTQNQRERLLRSLKFEEMNKRRNEITDPEDAVFKRIFRPYDNTELASGSIDKGWQSFTVWLQSCDALFWIQGKPGSGKSTLVKHILSHKTTQELLDKSHSRTKLLSHFFWKIGSPLQSNMVGFYSSLAQQLLQDNDSLIDDMIRQFPFSTTKDYLNDWSVRELEKVVLAAFKVEAEKMWLCVFIDGLDEYTSVGGQEDLVERIQRLAQYGKVKLCVSSRSEPRLREQLDHAPNLKLQNLTWPDMKAYAQEELGKFENMRLSAQLSSMLTEKLLIKAQGVFLWLRLAIQSLKSGIQNKDEENLLMERLQQLPNELEDLYMDMWKRLNQDMPIYKRSAANYFQLLITGGKMDPFGLQLLEIGLSTEKDIRSDILDISNDVDNSLIKSVCNRTENEIHTRCAGLLEIYEPILLVRVVRFVHRTAHDFLTGTAAGKQLLSHSTLSPAEAMLELTKSRLGWARVQSREFGDCSCWLAFTSMLGMALKLQGANRPYTKEVLDLLVATTSFYPRRWPEPNFLSVVAAWPLDGFVLAQPESISASLATDVLIDVSSAVDRDVIPSMNVVQTLLSCGADPSAIKTRAWKNIRFMYQEPTAVRTNALWNMLTGFHIRRKSGWKYDRSAELVAEMLGACPRADSKGLVAVDEVNAYGQHSSGLRIESFASESKGGGWVVPIVEVNTAFLLTRMLASWTESSAADLAPRLREVRAPLDDVISSLRFISTSGSLRHGSRKRWFKVVDQQPLADIVSLTFDSTSSYMPQSAEWDIVSLMFYNPSFDTPQTAKRQAKLREWYETFEAMTVNPDVLQEIEYEDILREAGEEGLLGPCTLEDAGCSWSAERRRFTQLDS